MSAPSVMSARPSQIVVPRRQAMRDNEEPAAWIAEQIPHR